MEIIQLNNILTEAGWAEEQRGNDRHWGPGTWQTDRIYQVWATDGKQADKEASGQNLPSVSHRRKTGG